MAKSQTEISDKSIECLLAEANAEATKPKIEPLGEEINNLSTLSRNELETLTRRLLCQCGQAAMMSEDETAQAILDRFAAEAINPRTTSRDAATAGNGWLDRKQGKAVQRVESRNLHLIADLEAEKEKARQQAIGYLEALAGVKTISSVG